MQPMKRPAPNSGAAREMTSESDIHAIAGTTTHNSGRNSARLYQRGWSKQMMNVTRYSASGTTHRNGTEATFWVTWLVIASSSAEPMPASTSQVMRVAAGAG